MNSIVFFMNFLCRCLPRLRFLAKYSQNSSTPPPNNNIPIKITLKESELEESFVKGSGPGGQKINKNRSNVIDKQVNKKVQLLHIPTGIRVETQRFRELFRNRVEARKLLTGKLDDFYNGKNSKKALEIKRIRRMKASKAQKSRRKYGNAKDENSLDDT